MTRALTGSDRRAAWPIAAKPREHPKTAARIASDALVVVAADGRPLGLSFAASGRGRREIPDPASRSGPVRAAAGVGCSRGRPTTTAAAHATTLSTALEVTTVKIGVDACAPVTAASGFLTHSPTNCSWPNTTEISSASSPTQPTAADTIRDFIDAYNWTTTANTILIETNRTQRPTRDARR